MTSQTLTPSAPRRGLALPWLAGAAALATVAATLGLSGFGEIGLNLTARHTARLAFVPFALAFGASPLHRLWPTPPSRWLLRNRRALGISYGVTQFIHMLAVLAVIAASEATLTGDPANFAGGLGFVFAFAMAATSNEASVRRLGRRWKQLHVIGGWYILGIYAFSYGGRFLVEGTHVAGFATVVAIAVGRVVVALRRR